MNADERILIPQAGRIWAAQWLKEVSLELNGQRSIDPSLSEGFKSTLGYYCKTVNMMTKWL